MANFNQSLGYPNIGDAQKFVQQPIQYPYGNNSLMVNTPYENYMGKSQQNLFNNQFLKCRPVSSKEQAQALQIDLDGSLWVFTDIGNEKIYTKQINADGTASFKTYGFIKDQPPTSSNEYVTKEEFNQVLNNLVSIIKNTDLKENNDKVNTLLNFN